MLPVTCFEQSGCVGLGVLALTCSWAAKVKCVALQLLRRHLRHTWRSNDNTATQHWHSWIHLCDLSKCVTHEWWDPLTLCVPPSTESQTGMYVKHCASWMPKHLYPGFAVCALILHFVHNDVLLLILSDEVLSTQPARNAFHTCINFAWWCQLYILVDVRWCHACRNSIHFCHGGECSRCFGSAMLAAWLVAWHAVASEVSVYTPGRISMVHACWSASRAVESHEFIFGPTVELSFASSSSTTSSELMHSRMYSSPSSLLCHADVCFFSPRCVATKQPYCIGSW